MINRSHILGLVVLGLVVLVAASSGLAEDWPRFRGPSGDGRSDEKLDLLDEPAELWRAKVGEGSASLVVTGDRLFTLGRDGDRRVVCLDATNGREIWSRTIESWTADSTPTVVGDRLYLLRATDKPYVECRSTKDGELLWTRTLPKPTGGTRHYGHAGSPLVTKDLVVLNAGTGVAVKRTDGEVAWSFEGLPGLATPVPFEHEEKPAVAIFCGKSLIGRDLATGRELWSIPWETNLAVNACDPIVAGGRLFLCTDYGKHAAMFDLTTSPPEQLWKDRGSSFSSGLRAGNTLYFFAGGHIVCRDWKSGEEHWRGPHMGSGSVIATPDHLVVVNQRGEVIVAPASTTGFEPTIRKTVLEGTTWTPPALSSGRLFVRNKAGEIVCLRIGKVVER